MEQDQTLILQTRNLIAQDFELPEQTEPEELVDEAALLQLLCDRVAWMIDHQMEQLLSLLYRMDIDENMVRAALSPTSLVPPHLGVATLILERQKRRVQTKRAVKVDKLEDIDEDMRF